MTVSNLPYQTLTPDVILNAVESAGYRCDGRLLALNSYENRVYQIGMESGEAIIAKFYRPNRWENAAIREEHAFTKELADRELPVVTAYADSQGETLHIYEEFRFALYPKRPGRMPELDQPETLEWMGRFIGRIHAVGALRPFRHRSTLDVENMGDAPFAFILKSGIVPSDLGAAYTSVVQDLLRRVHKKFEDMPRITIIRLHGDCHPGNVLWSDDGPHFVDFDDCRMGPAIQDLWMLLSGSRDEMTRQLRFVLDGYNEFHDFDAAEIQLLEPLRTLRMIHYAGWLAKRWDDPAFKTNFPWFNTQKYWQDHILALREQAALLDEPPLAWWGP